MSEQKIIPAMEALKELPDEDKQFMLGYAAGVVSAKQPAKEPEKKGDEKNA